MDIGTAQRAYDILRNQGIRGTLVGTAALQLRGYRVFAPDLDFLCERKPEGIDDSYGAAIAEPFKLDNVKVDFIGKPDIGQRQFFHPERAEVIAGIPVAAVEDIIGLKRWADREKDRQFMLQWDAGMVERYEG